MWAYQHISQDGFLHYGVKGMKWGVRRTPEQLGRVSGEVVKGSKKATALKIGLAAISVVTGIPVEAMGSYIAKKRADRKSVDEDTSLKNTKFTPDLKLKETSAKDDVKRVNPGYTGFDGANSRNCSNCTIAYEMRRRGYDVTAKGLYSGRQQEDIYKLFGNPTKHTVAFEEPKNSFTRGKRLKETVANDISKKMPNGSRGAILVSFRSGGAGHIFNWEVDGGKTKFIDAQVSSTDSGISFSEVAGKSVRYFRTDNAKTNMSLVGNAVENRRKGK